MRDQLQVPQQHQVQQVQQAQVVPSKTTGNYKTSFSNKFIPADVDRIVGRKTAPDMSAPIDQLAQCRVTQIHTCSPDSNKITSIGFTLNDG